MPQQRGILHHGTGKRGEQAEPDQPEIPVLKRDERAAGKEQSR
jgi:hypothetical protein